MTGDCRVRPATWSTRSRADFVVVSSAEHILGADGRPFGAEDPTYWVRVENLPALHERIDRIDRRARRLGTGPVSLVDTRIRRRGRAIVVLRGESPRLAGWRLVAVVDHRGGTAALRPVPGGPVMSLEPARWTTATCDHCRVARRRKDTFVLLRVVDGAMRQVGSS